MSEKLIRIGKTQAHWNVKGTNILKYSVEISHSGLKEYKLVSAPEKDILQNKVNMQVKRWKQKWEAIEEKRKQQEAKEANLQEAENRTNEAQEALHKIDNLLNHTLSIDDTVDWESIKKKDEFNVPKPEEPKKENYKDIPAKPDEKSPDYVPKFSLFERLFKKQKVIEFYGNKFSNALKDWEELKKKTEAYNKNIDAEYSKNLEEWKSNIKKWEDNKILYYKGQKEFNDKIEKLKEEYFNKNNVAVTEYCEIVLNNSEYPGSFSKNYEIEYNPENKILVVEYQLPSTDNLPNIKEVKYIAAKGELKESYIAESQMNKMFDSAIYQITLRTIHELFEADAADALSAISFNGWVNSISKATGQEENKCILSIQTNKEEFNKIALANVDPKICFKNLKGVASSKLSTLTPIQPILKISKTDKRFVEGYDVANELDDSTNVAAMDCCVTRTK